MPKERSGVKLAIWLLTTKSKKLPWFPCVQVQCDMPLESSQQRIQLCFRRHFNWRSAHKVMGPQSCESPNFGNFGTLKWVLVFWLNTEYTIKGKVVASPKSRLWWVLWVRVCLWLVHALKCSNYALTNLLFGLCRCMWVIELLVNLPSPHPRASTRPSTPEVLQTRKCVPTPSPFAIFTFGLVVRSIKELGGVSTM